MRFIKQYIRFSFSLMLIILSIANGLYAPLANALTRDDLNAINKGTTFYQRNDVVQCGTGNTNFGAVVASAGAATIWNSGLQPPYILEQFAIETIKDIAKKTNTDPSTVVTKSHVIALLAFMYGEGGDINNDNLFNPLNTGLNAPDLLASSNNASGLQSFKSFDAGVEATARAMTLSNQSRLAGVLMQPDSTPQQFMYALTYYNKYPGNKLWAEASTDNPAEYYQTRLNLVNQVTSRYSDIASTVLGTPAKEQIENIHDASKLQLAPAGSTSTNTTISAAAAQDCTGGAPGSDGGVVAGSIVQTALNLAWDTPGHGRLKGDAKPTYQVAMPQYNGSSGDDEFSDCGVFVATVMISSGADTSYPKRGTGEQRPYLDNSPKYQSLGEINDTSQLKPGDILISSSHTFMYVGPQPAVKGKSYNSVAASLGDHVPQADNFYNYGFRGYHLK